MTGMSNRTGRKIDRVEHIKQSVADILFTPIGSRVMRRDYGSQLPELIDQPLNTATLMRCRAAAIDALIRWEDRLHVEAVDFVVNGERLTVDITGTDEDGNPLAFSLDVPRAGAAA